jgi:hypothetical protein
MSIRRDDIVRFTKEFSRYISFTYDLVKPTPIKKRRMVCACYISPDIISIGVINGIPLQTVRTRIYFKVKKLAADLTDLDVADLRIDGRYSSSKRIVVIKYK